MYNQWQKITRSFNEHLVS